MYKGMIGINGTILGPRPSGLGVYAKHMIEELDRQGIDFILYTSYADGLALSEKNRKRIHKTEISVAPLDKGKHFLRHVWLQFFLPLLLRRHGVSVLLNLVPEGPLFTRTAQVTVVHDLIPLLSRRGHFLQRLNFRVLVPPLLKRSVSVVTDSEAVKKDLIRLFKIKPEKIHAIPLAFDARRFRPSDPQEAKTKFGLNRYFIYVGNILPHKNISSLIEAFGKAVPGSGHTLVIAGHKDRRYLPFLRDSIGKNALEKKVVFLDYVPDNDLPSLISGADALVLPSFFEGFGLTCLEAMACGCPVVSSELSSVREACADAAVYFDPDDPDELALILKRLSKDKDMRLSLKEKGLERSGHFSWEKCGMSLSNIIRNI